MKKYINGKVYDTNTAQLLASYEHSYKSQFNWYKEQLHRKRTGEFFLYGEGHADSPYCTYSADGGRDPGEYIIPMTYEEARQWAEKKLDTNEYDQIFGTPEEDDRTRVQIRLQESTLALLKDVATKEGTTMSAIVEKMIIEQLLDK